MFLLLLLLPTDGLVKISNQRNEIVKITINQDQLEVKAKEEIVLFVPSGKFTYSYDGKNHSGEVRAGETTQILVNEPEPPERAVATMTLILLMPENTTVKINGVEFKTMEVFRKLESPPLKVGQTYEYVIIASHKDIKKQEKISFRAGDRKIVNFDTMPIDNSGNKR